MVSIQNQKLFLVLTSSSKNPGPQIPELWWDILPVSSSWHIRHVSQKPVVRFERRLSWLSVKQKVKTSEGFTLHKQWYKQGDNHISNPKSHFHLFVLFCFCCHKARWGISSFGSSTANFCEISIAFLILLFMYSV